VVVISLLGLTSTYGLLSSIEKNKELQSVIDVKKESTAAIQAKIQSFLARYHKPEELLILLHKYGTGHQMYASEECKDLREIGGYFEQLGTDVRFKYIKFNYVFEIVDFPDDFWNLTAEIRREFRENNWSENGKGLPDFWSNFEYLKQRYENEYLLNRHSKTKRLKNQLDTLLDNRQNTKLEPLHNLKLNE